LTDSLDGRGDTSLLLLETVRADLLGVVQVEEFAPFVRENLQRLCRRRPWAPARRSRRVRTPTGQPPTNDRLQVVIVADQAKTYQRRSRQPEIASRWLLTACASMMARIGEMAFAILCDHHSVIAHAADHLSRAESSVRVVKTESIEAPLARLKLQPQTAYPWQTGWPSGVAPWTIARSLPLVELYDC
jgi:hypothetical protein